MAKGPTKQHYVPESYLSAWVDPSTPANNKPYVWIFNHGSRRGRRKAPSNIFKEKDLYTLKLKSGDKDYSIESTLSVIEGRYVHICREKISKHLPLTSEEHVYICIFVSLMLQRTLRYKNNLEGFIDELTRKIESLEKAHGAQPAESARLRAFKENIHKVGMINSMPDITKLLTQMSIAFLCTDSKSKFVTSDDPCTLFNPDLQWQRFYRPGLGQKNITLSLPISPDIMMCLSWSPLRGYIKWKRAQVNEANRMTVRDSYAYYISNSRTTNRGWFRSYPLDIGIIARIIMVRLKWAWHDLKFRRRRAHDR